MSRRKFLKGLGLVGGLLALSAPLTFRLSAQPPVVKVGTIFPYTGAGGEWGPVLRNTADLVANQVNEATTQVFGGPIIELIHEDDATTPAIGVDRARKLVEVDGVPVVVATWSSGVTIAIAEAVTMPAGVLHVVPIATSPLIGILPADANDMMFRTIGSDALQGVVAAQLARGEILVDYKFETAATIFVNNPYGQGLSNVFARSFQLRGGIITAQVPIPDEPQPTYTSQLALALKEEPEVLLPLVYPGHGTVLLEESVSFFGYSSWQFADALKSLKILEAIGPELLEGKLGTVQGSDPERPGFLRFAQDYEAAYGEPPPLPFMDTTYDAIAAVTLAIAKAVTDGVEITPVNLRDRLRPVANPPGELVGPGQFTQALQLLAEGKDLDYSGAAGEVNFDEFGEVVTPVEVWRFTGEGFETVTLRRAEEIPPE
jgi:ABC-type branched-subunit amino acid transport system substrate-binding protein